MKSALIVLMGAALAAVGFLGGWVLKGDFDAQTVSNAQPSILSIDAGGACCCGRSEEPTMVVVVQTVEVASCPVPTATPTAGLMDTATPGSTRWSPSATPTDEPDAPPTATPVVPTVGPTSTSTELPPATDIPTLESTNVPEPTATEKQKCNKGSGNGSEDCDPGNNPDNGNDDEDDD